jgi:hypothetical protein
MTASWINWAFVATGAFLIVSVFSKGDFYTGRTYSATSKPVPKWLGRSFFIAIGLFLIYRGLSGLHILNFFGIFR